MELTLYRQDFYADCTIGKLYRNDTWLCDVLEDYDRSLKDTDELAFILYKKVKGRTCIPYGEYEIDITYSPKFGKPMPLIKNVKGFDGVRVHSGNKAEDTDGCLIVGEKINKDARYLAYSHKAFEKIFDLIGKALLDDEVYLKIEKYGI